MGRALRVPELVAAARARLTRDGLLALQLRAQVLTARRGELDALAARLLPRGARRA